MENLERKLRSRVDTLGLSLEQTTKDMKLRDKKVLSSAHGENSFHERGKQQCSMYPQIYIIVVIQIPCQP